MTDNYFIPKLHIREYLEDRGRLAGSVLSWVDSEPERYGLWLAGKTSDKPTPAKGRGSLVHAELTEPETVREAFAFFPNRAEALTEETAEVVGPRGGVSRKKTGRHVPQDLSPAGERRRAYERSDFEKRQVADFLASAKGRTIVYPEDQPVIQSMVRAVWRHPEAAALLNPQGLGPEVTGHFTCPETGEPMRIRPDGLRIEEDIWIEIKTVEPRGYERIDTSSSKAAGRWASEGWARKSALLHDGCRLITGRAFTGYWIIIEAREDDPRVSVVRDDYDSNLHRLGVHGCAAWGIRGYLELIRLAQQMRAEQDFRHPCTREVMNGWTLPESIITSMMFEDNAAGSGSGHHHDDNDYFVPPIVGAVPMEEYDGQQR